MFDCILVYKWRQNKRPRDKRPTDQRPTDKRPRGTKECLGQNTYKGSIFVGQGCIMVKSLLLAPSKAIKKLSKGILKFGLWTKLFKKQKFG